MKKEFIPACLSLVLFSINGHALVFNVVPKAGTSLPTSVQPGSSVTAYYTVFNNTINARNNNFVKYFPPNVSQDTSGGGDTCGTTFSLSGKGQAGDSCTLQLTITGAVNSNNPSPKNHLFVCFPGGTSCAGTIYPLNVSSGATSDNREHFAYVPNFNNSTISLCNINANNGLLSGCTTTGTDFNNPSDIIFNSAGTLAYVTNYGSDDIRACSVEQATGELYNCFQAASFDGGSSPQGMVINPAGTRAYVVLDCTDEIQNCSINQTTGELINCIATNPETLFRPSDIVLNKAGTLAYIPNRDADSVSVCVVAQDTGLINTCTDSGSGFTTPEGVTLNSTGSLLYVGNDGDDTVTYCAVNVSDGSLSDCKFTGGDFDGFGNIILNGDDSHAYVPNSGSNTVSMCNVNSSNGELSACVNSQGTGFNGPASVMLH